MRDGFHVWAFLLAPIWMMVRGLWLTLVLYIAAMGLIQTALWALGASNGVRWTVALLIGLLIGLEAPTLRRWTYARRKWIEHGLVAASDEAEAERRFFDSYVPGAQTRPAVADPSPPPMTPMRVPPSSTEVIGLFPEPEPRARS